MNVIFKNLGKALVMIGSTILQLIAMLLRFISLIFECIGLAFRVASDFLANVSAHLLSRLGIGKVDAKTEAE